MSTNAASLTVVTPTFKPKQKQITHFIVIDPGLSYVSFGDVINIAYARELMYATEGNAVDYRVKVVPYTRNLHKQLQRNPKLIANLNTQLL